MYRKEMKLVKKISVQLRSPENVKQFVNIINKYSYDIDLRSGRHIVDAKSILGIFSLDLSKPIELEIYSDTCEELINEINKFLI
jgi:phosphocarrier protein HPr